MTERDNLLLDLLGEDYHSIGFYHPEDTPLKEAVIASYDKIIRLLPRFAKKTRILILNSGMGQSAHYIFDKFECRIDCLNNDLEQNEINHKRIASKGVEKKMNISLASTEEIPYDRESFDIIWSQDHFHEIPKKNKLFREIHRLLVPEGRLVFTSLYISDQVEKDDERKFISADYPARDIVKKSKYEKLARRSLLQPIYTLELRSSAKAHFSNVLSLIQEHAKDKKSKYNSSLLAATESEFEKSFNYVNDGKVEWGIFIYQKLNT